MDISTNTFDPKLSAVVIVMPPKRMNFKTCQQTNYIIGQYVE